MKRRKILVISTTILVFGIVTTVLLLSNDGNNTKKTQIKNQDTSHKIAINIFNIEDVYTLGSDSALINFIDEKRSEYVSTLSNVETTKFEVIINDEIIEDYSTVNYRDVEILELNVYETTIEEITKVEGSVTITSKVTTNYKNSILEDQNEEVISSVKTVPKDMSFGTVENSIYIENPSSLTAVVNKNRMLEGSYIPSNLVNITVTSTKSGNNNLIRSEVLPHLEDMFADAKSQGVNLTVTSAYRSFNTQNDLFYGYVSNYGLESALTFSAPPGASEHQTGLVLDIGEVNGPYDNFEIEFSLSDSGKWLAKNSHKYGFILRYPDGKENITTYQYEPWHFRFVGTDYATKIYESGLTLEEYFDLY